MKIFPTLPTLPLRVNGVPAFSNAQCPMPDAQCPMPNTQCPIPNVQVLSLK
ncbi:MAG: hypothetical protein F6J93_37625 [Oscillatoria sp. SIO1A7]|nr:hypothetical protein [Oscillatoria sp. SIO1A7]